MRSAAAMTKPDPIARGFAGAEVVTLAQLERRARPGDIVFFGLGAEIGRVFGKANADAAVRMRRDSARMSHWSRSQSAAYWDIGILAGEGQALLEDIVVTISALKQAALRPVMVACDHLASYAAVQALGEDAAYIYFDAHFDLGLHPGPPGLHNGNFVGALVRSRASAPIVNIGARSWTSHAAPYEEPTGVTMIAGRSAGEIIAQLAVLSPGPAYVSIDADVLDPALFPFSCCPEPFGLSHHDLLEICRWMGKNFTIIGCDISEFAPVAENGWASELLMRTAAGLFES